MRHSATAVACVLVAHAALALGAGSSQDDAAKALSLSRRMTLSGRWDAAASKLKKEIARSADRGDRRSEAAFRVELGRVLADQNFFNRRNPNGALETLNDALRFSRENGERRSEADAEQYLGQLRYSDSFDTRDWQTPRGQFLKVIEARQSLGDKRGLAESYFYLGLTYEQDGQPGLAMQNYRKSLSLSEEEGDPVLQSYAHRHIGGLQEEQGDLEAAERSISQSLALRRRAGFSVGVPFALLQMVDFVDRHRANQRQAMDLLKEAIDVAERSHSTLAVSAARLVLAQHYLAENRIRKALSYAKCARESASEFGDPAQVEAVDKEILEIRQRLEQ